MFNKIIKNDIISQALKKLQNGISKLSTNNNFTNSSFAFLLTFKSERYYLRIHFIELLD